VTIARADGSVVFIEMTSTTQELDGRSVVFSIGRDVTDTLEAQRKLLQSEQKYQSLVENVPDAVWSTAADGTLNFISPNIEKLCGYTAEQVMAWHGSDPNAHVHEGDVTRLDTALRALLREGTPLDIVYRRQHANGSWKWLQARGVAVRDEQGRVVRTNGILSDVTERRLLEDQLHRSQKLEAIGQLTGGVAHDFNNLLAVILGNAGFLLDELHEGDARRSDALDIRDAAERAAVLIRQLLAFSRQQAIAPVVFDLNAVVMNLQKMLRRVTSEDIELVVEGGAQFSRVLADPGQIEQVIMNLTVNARDAMPHGGVLHISTEEVDLPNGKHVCLRVRDTGVGMDEQVRQHIFEPFFTTKGPGKGTGLGLATCFGIVKHSGGFIDVESAPGVGTNMRVFLPLVQEERLVSAERAVAPAVVGGDETILLIEDDEQVQRTVVRVLKARGYRVLAASNGAGARDLAMTHATEIDLVLSDVVLADADGFDVADRVVELAPGAKVLFMSGHADHANLEGRQLEVSSTFMQKPFTPDSLAHKVRAVLDA
jgi:PAS domain S-box-containing protein